MYNNQKFSQAAPQQVGHSGQQYNPITSGLNYNYPHPSQQQINYYYHEYQNGQQQQQQYVYQAHQEYQQRFSPQMPNVGPPSISQMSPQSGPSNLNREGPNGSYMQLNDKKQGEERRKQRKPNSPRKLIQNPVLQPPEEVPQEEVRIKPSIFHCIDILAQSDCPSSSKLNMN